MISVNHIKKSFGKVTAVKDVSFTAENGQITGLLDPDERHDRYATFRKFTV